MPTVVIVKDETGESPDSTVTDTAIEDLLPPGFQLDDQQTEKQTDTQETTEAAEIIAVRVDTEPATVGRGVNKRELRSRTSDEKSQFMRKKNLIVWGIGALVIIVTMVVMLQLA
jgi:t-SNARE complex subunit (syntaxin)